MKKTLIILSLLLILAFSSFNLLSCENDDKQIIVCYNVENLFDYQHDSLKNDYDFLPDGNRHWTYKRMKLKMGNISRVIADIGNGKAPMIIGLCEIENERVLKSLTRDSPLSKFNYNFIHEESRDPRGIDVALLYDKKKFRILDTQFLSPSSFPTRDILYAKGVLKNRDTLHVFLLHAPSQINKGHQQRREAVLTMIKRTSDSILRVNPKTNVIIMGDMNANPTSPEIEHTLHARHPQTDAQTKFSESALYNLSYHPMTMESPASYYYKGEWKQLDQIIVNGSLLDTTSSSFVEQRLTIFARPYMLRYNSGALTYTPARTYNGHKYLLNSYSDHLPVFIQLTIRNEKLAENGKTH